MRSREEFGKYLLLKKLSEDPLGETFRAGRVAGGSVEQVVLLRVFNGRNVDGTALAARLEERQTIHDALKNPNIGNGVDLGQERGVPYVAYDYISGRNLESLLIQASNANSPIPVDHALLIAERTSLALAAAAETRVGEERVLHGFAVPHLVMVSNEGETRVLGFESAPGLAAQAGSFEGQITRYLAPEVVAGQPVDRSDDVFTLGAVLFELLACKPLPQAGASGYGPVVDGTQVAYDGTPFPTEVADLLKKSLVPRGQRVPDVATWHKSLSQLMADGGYAATTFNLAFFMHNLFRQEIEQENREIEEEKTLEVATPAAATADEPPPETAAAEAAPAAQPEEKKKGGMGLVAGLAAVLLVALLGAGWFFLGRGGEEAAEAANQPPPSPPVEEAPPEPAGPTPEELQAQIAEMLEARSQQMEDKLGQQYDEQIQALQTQLAEARSAAEEAAAERERQRLEEERRQQEEAERLAAEAAAEEERRLEEERRQEEARKQAEAEAAAEEAAAAQARPEPPPEPAVKEGDLVTPGPGVRPPVLTSEPQARYPPMARRLKKEADVAVRALVDERGNVRDVELAGEKAGFGLDQAALDAARSARFDPATKNGVRVKMYYTLIIKFRL